MCGITSLTNTFSVMLPFGAKRTEVLVTLASSKLSLPLKNTSGGILVVAFLSKTVPEIGNHWIVQLDEIALSISGVLSGKNRFVGEQGQPMIATSCPLLDNKKIATGLFFLATTKIPPLVFFKGSDNFDDARVTSTSVPFCAEG